MFNDFRLAMLSELVNSGIDNDSMRRVMCVVDKIGVHITPHIFRHTTISTALRNGMPIQNVAKMVGHSEIKTTMYYAQIDTGDIQYEHTRFVV